MHQTKHQAQQRRTTNMISFKKVNQGKKTITSVLNLVSEGGIFNFSFQFSELKEKHEKYYNDVN
jgi:phage head maturation protease